MSALTVALSVSLRTRILSEHSGALSSEFTQMFVILTHAKKKKTSSSCCSVQNKLALKSNFKMSAYIRKISRQAPMCGGGAVVLLLSMCTGAKRACTSHSCLVRVFATSVICILAIRPSAWKTCNSTSG